MAFYGGFSEYVPVAERRIKAQKSIDKLKKKNPQIAPIIISGRNIATTWWGKSWNKNLESYADYANRIDRGRSYVRHGAVLDLQIAQGSIQALVQGSGSKPYQVNIVIKPLSEKVWGEIAKECSGKLDSLQELMQGKFPKQLAALFTSRDKGLFPSPKEIALQCSCPDSAIMCKHVAAVLYGIGARLDVDAGLFFLMRNVNVGELITETIHKKSQELLAKSKTKGRRVIQDTDISEVFGIDIET